MVETETNCEPCQREDIKKKATVYCYECSERMCDGCKGLHKKIKLLSGHKLVKIEDKKEDIAKLDYLKSLTQCPDHNSEEFKYICKDHDQLCCNECAIERHRKCEHMVAIVCELAAAESETKDIKLRLEELEQFTDKLVEYEKKHQTIVEKSQSAVKDKLVQLKKTVDEAYKQLEEKINTDLEEKGKQQLRKCAVQKQEIGKLKSELKRSREKLTMVSEYGKNMCAYLIARDLENDMKEHEAALSTLHTKTSKASLYVTETKTTQELVKTISTCIHVKEKFSVEDIPSCPGFVGVGKRGTKGDPVMICEHKLSLSTGYARSCIWIGNFVVVALQEMKEIQIFENANIHIKFHAKTAVSSEPWSLAKIDDVRFAICFPHNKTIQTMKIDNGLLRVLSTFSTSHDVWDITYNTTDDQLISLSRSGMIELYKLSGTIAGSIPLNGELFTAVRNAFTICYDCTVHALYISSQGLHKMVAIDMKGKVLFEYKHSKLQYPRRPDTDADGNIYVPCYGGDNSSSMHELDKTGKLVREIRLSGAGFCVSFDENRSKFVVCCDEHAEPYIQIYGFK